MRHKFRPTSTAVILLTTFFISSAHAARANQQAASTGSKILSPQPTGPHSAARENDESREQLDRAHLFLPRAEDRQGRDGSTGQPLNPGEHHSNSQGFRVPVAGVLPEGAAGRRAGQLAMREAGSQAGGAGSRADASWMTGFKDVGLRALQRLCQGVLEQGSGRRTGKARQGDSGSDSAATEGARKQGGSFLRAWPESDSSLTPAESESNSAKAGLGSSAESNSGRPREWASESTPPRRGEPESNSIKAAGRRFATEWRGRGRVSGTGRRVHGNAPAFKAPPEPRAWPEQFHAQLLQNRSNALALVDLWYDWPRGRNLNLIRRQLSSPLWDVEWTNGTSFYFDLHAKTCFQVSFPVGILAPDWLRGAKFLGIETIDGGFECYVWTKADFITYYEDITTRNPVRWNFHSGPFQMDVMSFEPGKVLEDEKWQAPKFCFEKTPKEVGEV